MYRTPFHDRTSKCVFSLYIIIVYLSTDIQIMNVYKYTQKRIKTRNGRYVVFPLNISKMHLKLSSRHQQIASMITLSCLAIMFQEIRGIKNEKGSNEVNFYGSMIISRVQ